MAAARPGPNPQMVQRHGQEWALRLLPVPVPRMEAALWGHACPSRGSAWCVTVSVTLTLCFRCPDGHGSQIP